MLVALLRLYRTAISPLLPASCRFYPSCSQYAEEAVLVHGPWRGSLLAARRLLRCRPFGNNGYDPVPERPLAPPDRLAETRLRDR